MRACWERNFTTKDIISIFFIENFQFICSNIPVGPAYGVYISLYRLSFDLRILITPFGIFKIFLTLSQVPICIKPRSRFTSTSVAEIASCITTTIRQIEPLVDSFHIVFFIIPLSIEIKHVPLVFVFWLLKLRLNPFYFSKGHNVLYIVRWIRVTIQIVSWG